MNQLDHIDQQILNLLSQNARISYQAIAEQVGLSRTAVTKRIQTMEESGIIKGYKVITSP